MGAAQPNISQVIIRNLQILKPLNNVLGKYNNLVIPIFDEILALQKKNVILIKLRDLLILQLITGKRSLKTEKLK